MLGVLAFGDSITNGGGELQWGVALQSWALWTARSLGLPYTPYAADGATVHDVLHQQIPAFERRAAEPDGRYDLGCLYIGTNDVRGFDWDPFAYERDLRAAMGFLSARCERTLTATIPLDLGRPRAGAKVRTRTRSSSAARARPARSSSTSRGFRGRRVLMADHVHPTAFGQIAIAERALAVLERDGMTVRTRPASWSPVGVHPPAPAARRRDLPLPPREGQRQGGGEPAQAAARPRSTSRRSSARRSSPASVRPARRGRCRRR